MASSIRWTWAIVMAMLWLVRVIDAGQADDATPAAVLSNNSPGDTFYDRPTSVSRMPGVLLRSEPLTDRVLPDGTQAWRIQYTSTAPDGSPAISVATVVAPLDLADSPMPVIAWDHGAVGLVQRCLPSATLNPLMGMPALAQAVAQNWIVVATDYQTDSNGVNRF
jgi:hypothetical protein